MSNQLFTKSKNSKHFDLVVVGGGLTGLLMVYILLKSQIVTKNQLCWINPDENIANDDRVSFYNAKNINELKTFNLLNDLSDCNFNEVNEIQVLIEGQKKPLTWNEKSNLGLVLKNNVIQKLIKSKIQTNIINSKVINSDINKFERFITLENGQIISSNLIIGADGSNSKLRELCSINYYSHDLKHVAISGHLQINAMDNKIARQVFLKEGPIGLLPVKYNKNHINYVWSVKNNFAEKLLKHKNFPLFIADRLNKVFLKMDTKFSPPKNLKKNNISKINRWPLKLIYVPKPIEKRIVLVGDAAHSIHPMAGQGLNLSIEDCFQILKVLKESIELGKDFGDHDNLIKYQKKRSLRVKSITFSTTSLFYSFNTNSNFLNKILSAGMEKMDNFSIKDIFKKIASG